MKTQKQIRKGQIVKRKYWAGTWKVIAVGITHAHIQHIHDKRIFETKLDTISVVESKPTEVATPKLTDNEIEALKMCLNYSSREAQLSDNYSNGGAEEFATLFDGNLHSAGGLITSLTNKGMGYPDDDGVNGEDVDVFWLTEDGVNAIFDIIENEVQ